MEKEDVDIPNKSKGFRLRKKTNAVACMILYLVPEGRPSDINDPQAWPSLLIQRNPYLYTTHANLLANERGEP